MNRVLDETVTGLNKSITEVGGGLAARRLVKGQLPEAGETAGKVVSNDAKTLTEANKNTFEEVNKQFAKNAPEPDRRLISEVTDGAGKDAVGTIKSLRERFGNKALACFSLASMVVIGAVGVGLYLVINPRAEADKKNGTVYKITNISDASALSGTKGDISISYTPGVALYNGAQSSNPLGDILTFEGTDCTPNINGSYYVVGILSPTVCIINLNNSTIKTSIDANIVVNQPPTSLTKMTLSTTYENQMSLQWVQIGSFFKGVGSGLGGAAGNLVGGAIGGAAKPLAGGINDAFKAFYKTFKVPILIVCSIIVLVIIVKLYTIFHKKKTPGPYYSFGRRRRR